MDPEPDLDKQHSHWIANLWPLILETIHSDIRKWSDLALKECWKGDQILSLIAIPHPYCKSWFWSMSKMQFEADDKHPSFKEIVQFINARAPEAIVPEAVSDTKAKQWDLHLLDGGLIKIEMGFYQQTFVGKRCSIPLCQNRIHSKGSLANIQLSEQAELSAAQGNWSAQTYLLADRYYCLEHTMCYKDFGTHAEAECRGPLYMITTRLVPNGFSGDQLDGNLFCNIHAPHGPRHLLMVQKR